MNRCLRFLLTGLIAAAALLAAGCEDSKSDKAPSVDVTGRWHVSADSGDAVIAQLTQTGSDVSGWATSSDGDSGSCSGTVSGNKCSFNIAWRSGFRTEVSMRVEGDHGSGSFKNSDGSRGSYMAIRR